MTPKLLAKPPFVTAYPKHAGSLITQCGRKFVWMHLARVQAGDVKVGDKVWLARRLNVPTSDWCYELYQVTVQEHKYLASQGHKGYPQLHFSGDRDVVWEVK